ncbi:MAG: acetolactate synthase small subunit [Actinobacteria bacterium]|nr:MAG: acetolactate synthase small subunit [Actinomycetota bacterium]
MSSHTLSVLVENKPGVLARVAQLFSRRGFNIDSLKLVNVLKIVELEASTSVQRELLLVKVRADRPVRSQVLETVNLFRARVVDVAADTLTIEATGTADKLDALLRDLEPFGIKEMVQSGLVAIGRGSRSITGPVLRTTTTTAA